LIAQVIVEDGKTNGMTTGSGIGVLLTGADGGSDQPEQIKRMRTNIAVERAGPTVSVSHCLIKNKGFKDGLHHGPLNFINWTMMVCEGILDKNLD